MNKYTLGHVGTMNSQYFGGNHNPVVQVMVDGTTTYAELKDRLLSICEATDHIEELDVPAYVKAVELMFNLVAPEDMENLFDSRLDVPYDEEWDDYDCYAYFVLETNEVNEDE